MTCYLELLSIDGRSRLRFRVDQIHEYSDEVEFGELSAKGLLASPPEATRVQSTEDALLELLGSTENQVYQASMKMGELEVYTPIRLKLTGSCHAFGREVSQN